MDFLFIDRRFLFSRHDVVPELDGEGRELFQAIEVFRQFAAGGLDQVE